MPHRILLVEDNPIEAAALNCLVRQAGFDVITASDAEVGFQRLLAEEFELLLCDLHLPGENGFDLCRRVKHSPRLRRLPVVLLTRLTDPLNVLRGLEAGADGFISKDLNETHLVRRLQRVLSRRRDACRAAAADRDRVVFLDQEFELSAERGQLLEVLLSGFEDVVQLNAKYEAEAAERARAQKALHEMNTTLEERVVQRTKTLNEYVAELERKNAELDQFVFMASHDLQEPIRKLVSFSQLLEADLKQGSEARVNDDLHYITTAAKRMQTLVRDLLQLSRAGRSAMRRELVDLNRCADAALETLSLRVAETGAVVTRNPLPTVVGDPTTLTQLYQNLIQNALKFIGDSPPRISLTAEEGPDYWTLGVCDEGIGIDPEYAEQIFAPFQRLHDRERYEGTGIGLSICRTTVERHGGKIWVESEPGCGARFRFTLNRLDTTCPVGTSPRNGASTSKYVANR